MKSGVCPRCECTEVYRSPGNLAAQEAIVLKGGILSKGATPDKYLCAACGYLEYYLPLTSGNLEMIRENWERVAVS